MTLMLCIGGFAQAVERDAVQLASVYVDAGRLKDAVALLKEIGDADDDPTINLLTGKIYLAIDKPAKALPFFERAAAQAPDMIDAQRGLALGHLKLGQFAQARVHVQALDRLEGAAPVPSYLHAVILARTGWHDQATREMEAAQQRHPNSEPVAIARARFHASIGEAPRATELLASFVVRQPEAARAREYLGELYQKAGDRAAAIRERSAALQTFRRQGDRYRAAVMTAWLEAQEPAPPAEAPAARRETPAPDRAPPPAAQTRRAAPDDDARWTVQRFPFPAGVNITGGSGFIVDAGRKVVTNRHVIEGGKAFAIRTSSGEVIGARVAFISDTDDLAVLALDKPLPADSAIPPSGFVKPKVGRNVVVMGYPLWYLLGEGSPSLTNGIVSKRTGLKDDPSTFQMTAKINRGNSGGPVFDMRGNVVGITVGKLDIKRIGEEQGFLPEDVNFAIHVDRLPAFLKVRPATDSAAEQQAGEDLSAEALYQAMMGKVVMVATYK